MATAKKKSEQSEKGQVRYVMKGGPGAPDDGGGTVVWITQELADKLSGKAPEAEAPAEAEEAQES